MMPTTEWVQYGCFSLVAALVIWSLAKGIPSVLQTHRESLREQNQTQKESLQEQNKTFREALVMLTTAFQGESLECRSERRQEREMDRVARHQVAEKMQEAVGELSKIVTAFESKMQGK